MLNIMEQVNGGNFYNCMPIGNDTDAFIKEAEWMKELAGDGHKLLNKIASPGFKKGNIEFSKTIKDALFKSWRDQIKW